MGWNEYSRGTWFIKFFRGRCVTLEGRSLSCKKPDEEPFRQKPLLFKKGQGARSLAADCLKLLGGLLSGNASVAQIVLIYRFCSVYCRPSVDLVQWSQMLQHAGHGCIA